MRLGTDFTFPKLKSWLYAALVYGLVWGRYTFTVPIRKSTIVLMVIA